MSEPSSILILLLLVCIWAYFDKSGKQGCKRRNKFSHTKTLSSMKRALSDEQESPGAPFEPSIHDGISFPGGYHAYLLSNKWRAKRNLVVARDGYQCQDCLSIKFLEVHHKSYDFLFREEENDYESLVTLCRSCHQSRHDNDPELFTYKG